MKPRTYSAIVSDLVKASPEGVTTGEVFAALRARGFRLDSSSAAKSLRRLAAQGEIGLARTTAGGVQCVYCPVEFVDAVSARLEAERLKREEAVMERRRERNRKFKKALKTPEDEDRPFVHRWTGFQRIASHQLAACVNSVWELAK